MLGMVEYDVQVARMINCVLVVFYILANGLISSHPLSVIDML